MSALVPVRVAVAGASGKMGSKIANAILQNANFNLVAVISSQNLFTDNQAIICVKDFADIDIKVDLLIDFTRPEPALYNLSICQKNKTAMLIGTTGFTEAQMQTIELSAQNTPVLFAPNTSLGINIMQTLLKQMGALLKNHTDVDIEIIEAHHNKKIDSPSGTALILGNSVADAFGIDLEQSANMNRTDSDQPRQKNEIGFSVIRAGNIIGDHKVLFALGDELITIEHNALNRDLFVNGAIFAASWLAKQKPAGLFTMQNALACDV